MAVMHIRIQPCSRWWLITERSDRKNPGNNIQKSEHRLGSAGMLENTALEAVVSARNLIPLPCVHYGTSSGVIVVFPAASLHAQKLKVLCMLWMVGDE